MSLIIDAYFRSVGIGDRKIAVYDIFDRAEPYHGEIIRFGPLKIAASTRMGGFVKPQFGSLEVTTDAIFQTIPGTYSDFEIYLVTADSDVFLADARGRPSGLDEATTSYEIYPKDSDEDDTTTGTASTQTVEDYFDFFCGASYLNRTLDYTGYTADEYVAFTVDGYRNLLEVMNEVAIWSSHAFWIEGLTLYLVDLEATVGSTVALTEYDFIAVEYEAPRPASIYRGGDYYVAGSYGATAEYTIPYVLHTTQSYIEACLTKKKNLMAKWWITVTMPIGDNSIGYGNEITFTDKSKYVDIDVEMKAREFHYSLAPGQEYLKISGEGTLSAAS